jgi:hypothetical protein
MGECRKSTLRLQICHANKVFELDNFYALNSNSLDSFEWRIFDNRPDALSDSLKHAIKLGFDTLNQTCLYAGRTVPTKYGTTIIGRVANRQLNVAVPVSTSNKEAQTAAHFEILCAKPSPSKLKSLCRFAIRSRMNHDNLRIGKLLLESRFIKYLKYKVCSFFFSLEFHILGFFWVHTSGAYFNL